MISSRWYITHGTYSENDNYFHRWNFGTYCMHLNALQKRCNSKHIYRMCRIIQNMQYLPSTISLPTVLWSPILAEYSAPSSNTDFSIVRVCWAPSSFNWMRLSGLVIFLPFLNHWTFLGLEVTHLKVTLSPSGMVKSLSGVINVTGKAANHILSVNYGWENLLGTLEARHQGARTNKWNWISQQYTGYEWCMMWYAFCIYITRRDICQ